MCVIIRRLPYCYSALFGYLKGWAFSVPVLMRHLRPCRSEMGCTDCLSLGTTGYSHGAGVAREAG